MQSYTIPALKKNMHMTPHRKHLFLIFVLLAASSASCDKEKEVIKEVTFIPKDILYVVKGTQLKLNFIDSQSVFQKDRVFKDSFHYQFKKGPGASIGITVNRQSTSDTIYSWHIFINGKLFANAFSEGGAYFTIPYD